MTTAEIKPEPTAPHQVTQLLEDWLNGDQDAFNNLIPLVHEELCTIARARLRRERSDHTFPTHALVNEVFIRMCGKREMALENRIHFFGIAARSMRQILIDHAREHSAEKRGGRMERVYVSDIDDFSDERAMDLIKLDQALKDLERMDPKKCRLVEMRFFAGLTIEESATVLKISAATIKRDWQFARAWLLRQLDQGEAKK